MGRASNWIRNFLIGKREEKGKKTAIPAVNSTTKVGSRWSFKRSTSTKAVNVIHKRSGSFDSRTVLVLSKQVLLESREMHAAATRIQVIYRSYLARKALRALRGLVKLQALVRGYLVRKQMNAILRSMHALMAIQVRARVNRIQIAEEPPFMLRTIQEYPKPSGKNRFSTSSGGVRNKNGHTHHTPVPAEGIMEYDFKACSSGRLHKLEMCPSPSTSSFTGSTSTTYNSKQLEFPLKLGRINSRRYFACPRDKIPFIAQPNYMTNTESSKAKARSHSEPRQRPKMSTKQSSRRSSSMDWTNEYPLLIKLYRPRKSTTDS